MTLLKINSYFFMYKSHRKCKGKRVSENKTISPNVGLRSVDSSRSVTSGTYKSPPCPIVLDGMSNDTGFRSYRSDLD